VSSRIRPYLDLKKSIIALFKTPSHWLHEFVGKWSIFEKPYLDQDYRKMHLTMPSPDWPGSGGGGGFPESLRSTFIWDPGICGVGILRGACGEEFYLTASIAIAPPSKSYGFAWNVTVSDINHLRVTSIDIGKNSWSVDITGTISEYFNGTAIICVSVTNVGSLRHVLVVDTPLFVGIPYHPTYEAALMLPPVEESYYEGNKYDCGCTEIEIVCCNDAGIAWDSDNSATTIIRGGEAAIAITDSLGTGGPPYYWRIYPVFEHMGSGFALQHDITDGLTNTLLASESACGAALIEVTGCGVWREYDSVLGCVACTYGAWKIDQAYPSSSPLPPVCDTTGQCWCSSGGPTVYFDSIHRANTNALTGGILEGVGECAYGIDLEIPYTYNVDGKVVTQKQIFDLVFLSNPGCNIVGCWEGANLEWWGCA